MLFSLSLMLVCGFFMGGLFEKLKLPNILGMLLTGMVLGPYGLQFIAPEIIQISPELRQIALIAILTRVGLSLDVKDLKKVGRPAIFMCFVPATFELLAVVLLAPRFFSISTLEAAIMGAVLAAVSPAVVVPRMLKLMETGYGKAKNIPQLIMASASVDDVYVIVLFTSFLAMQQGGNFQAINLLAVPVSVVLGLMLGIAVGMLLVFVFKHIHIRDTAKVMLLFATSFLFVSLETALKSYVPLSGLLAVMALGGTVLKTYAPLAKRLSIKFSKVWVLAEIVLFVLVGAAVPFVSLKNAGISAIVLVFLALLFRMVGVLFCLAKTTLNKKERLFCAIAFLPKATVQAAISGIPLAAGVPAGGIILAVAVLAIFMTAPLGAIGIDVTYKKLLKNDRCKTQGA